MQRLEEILRAFAATPADLALLVCYFAPDGNDATHRSVAEIITACGGGILRPITLVPQPSMHIGDMTVEIWGVARG